MEDFLEEILRFNRLFARKKIEASLNNLNTAIIIGEAGVAGRLALAAFGQLEEARALTVDVEKFNEVLRLFQNIVYCFSTVKE